MSIPVMPSTHTWVQLGPGFSKTGNTQGGGVALFVGDDADVWVWDEDTNTRVTDLLDASGSPVTSVPVHQGWLGDGNPPGVGVPVAVAVPSFSVGQFGKRMASLPVQTLRTAAASLAPTATQIATVYNDTGSAFRTDLDADLAAGFDPLLVGGKGTVRKGDLVFNVKDYGAVGDGATDDTAAFDAALAAGAGRTVYVPAGTYLLNTLAHDVTVDHINTCAIHLTTAKTALVLDTAATLKVATNNSSHASLITVEAADCSVTGGTLQGDLTTHIDTGGEWCYGIALRVGSDRFKAYRVISKEFWGDGFDIWGNPVDVAFIECEGIANRRQGMSIEQAIRPRVIGGSYRDTGTILGTSPMAGIDVEPVAGQSVVDAQIVGVHMTGNQYGLLVSGPGTSITGLATGNTMTGNRLYGLYTNSTVDLTGFKVTGNRIAGNTSAQYLLNNRVQFDGADPFSVTPSLSATTTPPTAGVWTGTAKVRVTPDGWVDYTFNMALNSTTGLGSGVYTIGLPYTAQAEFAQNMAVAGQAIASIGGNRLPCSLMLAAGGNSVLVVQGTGDLVRETGGKLNGGASVVWATGDYIRGNIRYRSTTKLAPVGATA